MPETQTINVARRITAVHVLDSTSRSVAMANGADGTQGGAVQAQLATAVQAERHQKLQELERKNAELCETVSDVVAKLDRLYRETVEDNRSDIARLAVEIARKILMHETGKGSYDIQAIVEEALKHAPTRQDITIRVNPEDLPRCQQLQHERPDSPLAELNFVADWGIARADCLVETPKGIIKSFVEEHLERISEALAQVE